MSDEVYQKPRGAWPVLRCAVLILDLKALPSALGDEIRRLIQRLCFQEIWRVTIIGDGQDIILKQNKTKTRGGKKTVKPKM